MTNGNLNYSLRRYGTNDCSNYEYILIKCRQHFRDSISQLKGFAVISLRQRMDVVPITYQFSPAAKCDDESHQRRHLSCHRFECKSRKKMFINLTNDHSSSSYTAIHLAIHPSIQPSCHQVVQSQGNDDIRMGCQMTTSGHFIDVFPEFRHN